MIQPYKLFVLLLAQSRVQADSIDSKKLQQYNPYIEICTLSTCQKDNWRSLRASQPPKRGLPAETHTNQVTIRCGQGEKQPIITTAPGNLYTASCDNEQSLSIYSKSGDRVSATSAYFRCTEGGYGRAEYGLTSGTCEFENNDVTNHSADLTCPPARTI